MNYFYFHILKELMLDFSTTRSISTNNVILCLGIRVKCVLIFARFYSKSGYVD